MAHLTPASSDPIDVSENKEKKEKKARNKRPTITIDGGAHKSIESALRDPAIANQLTLRFKYSDYLRSLNEILDVVGNIQKVSSEEAEHIAPLRVALNRYAIASFDKLFRQSQLAELERKHQAECHELRTRIASLEDDNSNFRKLISMGDNAFLLDDSCSTVHLKMYSKIEEELKICEDLIKKSSHFRIHVKRYYDADYTRAFVKLLASSIKNRFGREGWDLEVQEERAESLDFYLVPKKEALVAMGMTGDLNEGVLKPKKESMWHRFFRWFIRL